VKERISRYIQKLRLFFRVVFFSLLFIIAYIAFLPNYDALPNFTSLSDIFNHFIAFFVLAIFLDFGFSPAYTHIFISLCLYGLFIECVQYFLPNRAFDLLDIAVDISGIMMYLVIKVGFDKVESS